MIGPMMSGGLELLGLGGTAAGPAGGGLKSAGQPGVAGAGGLGRTVDQPAPGFAALLAAPAEVMPLPLAALRGVLRDAVEAVNLPAEVTLPPVVPAGPAVLPQNGPELLPVAGPGFGFGGAGAPGELLLDEAAVRDEPDELAETLLLAGLGPVPGGVLRGEVRDRPLAGDMRLEPARAAGARPQAVMARPEAGMARPEAVMARPEAVMARPEAVIERAAVVPGDVTAGLALDALVAPGAGLRGGGRSSEALAPGNALEDVATGRDGAAQPMQAGRAEMKLEVAARGASLPVMRADVASAGGAADVPLVVEPAPGGRMGVDAGADGAVKLAAGDAMAVQTMAMEQPGRRIAPMAMSGRTKLVAADDVRAPRAADGLVVPALQDGLMVPENMALPAADAMPGARLGADVPLAAMVRADAAMGLPRVADGAGTGENFKGAGAMALDGPAPDVALDTLRLGPVRVAVERLETGVRVALAAGAEGGARLARGGPALAAALRAEGVRLAEYSVVAAPGVALAAATNAGPAAGLADVRAVDAGLGVMPMPAEPLLRVSGLEALVPGGGMSSAMLAAAGGLSADGRTEPEAAPREDGRGGAGGAGGEGGRPGGGAGRPGGEAGRPGGGAGGPGAGSGLPGAAGWRAAVDGPDARPAMAGRLA